MTQDRRHCAQILDLDPIPHHFQHLYRLLLHQQTSLEIPLSLHQMMELQDAKKIKSCFKKIS